MSDKKKTTKKARKPVKLPPQKSPQDTSNWDERSFTTPSGRVVIETDQTQDNKIIVSE